MNCQTAMKTYYLNNQNPTIFTSNDFIGFRPYSSKKMTFYDENMDMRYQEIK